MNKFLLSIFIITTLCFSGFAQTTIINPTTDGGFESGSTFAANNWTSTSGLPNYWTVGTNATAGFSGTNAAYITNTLSATTHTYDITALSRSHFYRDVTIPAGETNIKLTFSWMGMGESANDQMKVWTTSTAFTPTVSANITAGVGRTQYGAYLLQPTWTTTSITLPASLAGTSFRLVFEWLNNNTLGTNPPAAVDNISLVSSCPGVVATNASPVNNTSALLNWNTLSGATSYSVQYKDASSGTWLNAPGNPYAVTSASITGLIASTNYQYRVAAMGGTVCAVFSNTVNFTTLCNAYTSIPYLESFDNVTFPTCWSSSLITGTSNWITSANNGAVASPYAGSRFIGISGSVSNALLISPPFDLTAVGTVPTQVNMWIYRAVPGNSGPNDSIVLYLNTSPNLTGATQLLKVFPMMSKTPVVASAGWYNYIVTIPTSFNTGGQFFAIVQGSRASTNGIGVDEFKIELGPTCIPASGLSANTVTNNSVNIAWLTPSGGTPVNYKWEVRTSGAAGSGAIGLTGSGTVAAPTLSTAVSGLTGSTTYSVYVETDCGAGDLSTWTAAYVFTTLSNCPTPSSLTVSGVTSNSVNVSWVAGGSETNWEIYYGPTPLTAPNASTTPTGSVTVTSFTNSGLTPATSYAFYVRANCGAGGISTWSSPLIYSTPCISPNVTSTSSGSLCGTGSITLTATTGSGATILWYNNSFGGYPISTGTVYVTPSLSTTTNYYASAEGAISTYSVGKPGTTGTAFPPGNYLIFDAISNFTLSSVDVYAAGTGTGSVVVALQSSTGVTLQTATVTVTTGATVNTVPLNFSITPGSNYRLNCLSMTGGVTGLYRDNSGVSYPYTQLGIVSITGNSTPANYNFFYNWQVAAACESPRSTITATVIPIPTLSVTAPSSICGGSQTATLSITSTASNFDSYIWSPTTHLFTDAAATIPYAGGTANQLYVKSNSTGNNTYTVNASNSVNGCVNTSTSSVNIKEAPLNLNISITPSVICSGSATNFSEASVSTSSVMTVSDYTYGWTSSPSGFSASTASATTNPTISTTYSAVITNTVTSCAISGTVAVAVNAYPTVTVNPVSSSICSGKSATLTTTGTATNYIWTPGGINTATAVVTPTANTTYTLISSSNNCSVTNTASVIVNPSPTVLAMASASVICVGENAVLTASTSVTNYTWSPVSANTVSVSVTPTVTTNYTVTVSNGTCTAKSSVGVTVNLCAGINELSAGEISLYPNPNFGFVTIAFPDNLVNATVDIYDAIGKLVISEKLNKESNSINTSKLDNGIYIYKISNSSKTLKVGRIIKQ